MTIKTWWLTTHGIQENFYEGSLKEYNPTSRNEKKKSNKQSKLIRKASGKRKQKPQS